MSSHLCTNCDVIRYYESCGQWLCWYRDITLYLDCEFFIVIVVVSLLFRCVYFAVIRCCTTFGSFRLVSILLYDILSLAQYNAPSLFLTHTQIHIHIHFTVSCAFNFYVGAFSICDNSLWKLFCRMMMLQTLRLCFKYCFFLPLPIFFSPQMLQNKNNEKSIFWFAQRIKAISTWC